MDIAHILNLHLSMEADQYVVRAAIFAKRLCQICLIRQKRLLTF